MATWRELEEAEPAFAARVRDLLGAPRHRTEAELADGEAFVADITEVVVTGLDDAATMLVVESWTPVRGLVRVERA